MKKKFTVISSRWGKDQKDFDLGYNATIHIPNRLLSDISNDPGFGRKLADLVNAAMRSRATEQGDIHVGAVEHADHDQLYVILAGKLIRVMPDQADELVLQVISEIVDTQGGLMPIENPLTGEVSTREKWNHGFAPSVLQDASTTLVLLIDGLEEIRKDIGLGPRLVTAVAQFWVTSRLLENHPHPGIGEMRPPRDIHAGNHANAISIAAVTPPDCTDVILVGQNYGRAMRPYHPDFLGAPDGSRKELFTKLHARDLAVLCEVLVDQRAKAERRTKNLHDWSM